MTDIDYRGRLVNLMKETLHDEAVFHDWTYHAVRPMYVPSSWKAGQRVVADCSKGVQFLCRWAEVPRDPMNQNWNPYGNSSTLYAKLPHLSYASELLPGDIVTFGSYGGDHATMVLEAGSDPLLWSFGHQGAPNSYRLSWDRRYHQYLRLILPAHIPTPDDKLRAETGYWSWLQWLLGEGSWDGRGKKNPKIRPHVPTRIPAAWWAARAQFMYNRNKSNSTPG